MAVNRFSGRPPPAFALRDSKNPDGPVLLFTAFEWECFLDGVDKGEFRRG